VVNETLARRYATAVFELASDAKEVESVGTQLTSIVETLNGDPGVRNFFVSPVVSREDKERALLATFQGRVGDIALHTLLLLVRKRRETLLGDMVEEYRKIERNARGAELLVVTTARELSADELNTIVGRLERTYGKKFEASVKLDPLLIGGVRIAMGDRMIDGSVSGRLEELTRSLFGSGN
jgi:F-type H+-transporting ATPase subunit delta